METLTKELSLFIEEYSPLKYSNTLVNMGFTNSKNIVGNSIIKKDDGTIIFTEQNIKDFCKKYNLYWATSDRYIGHIPAENIKTIESYKPHETVYRYYDHHYGDWDSWDEEKFYSTEELTKTKNGFFSRKRYRSGDKVAKDRMVYKSSYVIVAPKADFNVQMDEESRTVAILDPAIFEKYFDIEKKCFMYQLITCWGPEQATPELQKDSLN